MRKLYKLGYYDNNVNKIGLMSRKKFSGISYENISSSIIKIEKFIYFLKQLNLINIRYILD